MVSTSRNGLGTDGGPRKRRAMTEVMRELERDWAREMCEEAEQGEVQSMVKYADMLSVGYGVQKNTRLARWWYREAQPRGSAIAADRLSAIGGTPQPISTQDLQ